MRLTRHAKNRLRYIARREPDVSEARLLDSLASGRLLDRDVKGNRRLEVSAGGILLTVVCR